MGLFDGINEAGRVLTEGGGGAGDAIAIDRGGRDDAPRGDRPPRVGAAPRARRAPGDVGPRFPELGGLLDGARGGTIVRTASGKRVSIPCRRLVLDCLDDESEVKPFELDDDWDPDAIHRALEARMEQYADAMSGGGDVEFRFAVRATFYEPGADGGTRQEQLWEGSVDLAPRRRERSASSRASGRDASRPDAWVRTAFNEKAAAIAAAEEKDRRATDMLQEQVRTLTKQLAGAHATIDRLQRVAIENVELQQRLLNQDEDRRIKDRRAKRVDDALAGLFEQAKALGKPMALGLARKLMNGDAVLSEAENRARDVARMLIGKLKEKTGGDQATAESIMRGVGLGDEEIRALGMLGADLALEDAHKDAIRGAQVSFGVGMIGEAPPDGRGPVRSLIEGL